MHRQLVVQRGLPGTGMHPVPAVLRGGEAGFGAAAEYRDRGAAGGQVPGQVAAQVAAAAGDQHV